MNIFFKSKLICAVSMLFYWVALLFLSSSSYFSEIKSLLNGYSISIISFVWFVGTLYVCKIYQKKGYLRIWEKALSNCDTSIVVQVLLPFSKNKNLFDKNEQVLFMIDLALAKIYLGENDVAFDLLQSIKISNKLRNKEFFRFRIDQYILTIYARKKDFDNAKIYLDKLEKTYLEFDKSNKLFNYIEKKYLLSLDIYNLLVGKMEELKRKYENDFLIAKTTFEKALLKSYLGRIYFLKNDFEKAKEAFRFVIENGNKLYCVNDAKEYLEMINGN